MFKAGPPRLRRRFAGRAAVACLVLALVGCGETMTGVYEEVSGIGRLEFQDDGDVYMTMFDRTVQAEYDVDGDRVIITGTRGSQIYQREGDALVGGLGMKFVKQ